MKKALFTDLDNTLIFSERFVKQFTNVERIPNSLVAIDKYTRSDGAKTASYINAELLLKLQETCKHSEDNLFIPVTSRSIRRYTDITPLAKPFRYAVTSGGGNVLIDGKVDLEYRETLKIDTAELQEIAQVFYGKVVDDTYVMAEMVDWFKFQPFVEEYDCLFDLKGRVNILPKKIDKSTGVQYLVNKLDINRIMCCGDTEVDLEMLDAANKACVPATSMIAFREHIYGGYVIYNPLSTDMFEIFKSFE
jgi:hypothetical protein